MAMTTYGDISPRTAAYAVREMLKQGMGAMAFSEFGNIVDTNDYDDDVLMICPDGNNSNPACIGCPCNGPHYSYECRDTDVLSRGDHPWECPDCEPIDEEQRKQNDVDFKDLRCVIWSDSIQDFYNEPASFDLDQFEEWQVQHRLCAPAKFRKWDPDSTTKFSK